MAGRPQRKLLENKPMPESPKIVKAAKAALASVLPGETVSIAVPWEDFVFSTREGKTYMPPTIRKGIEHARSEGYNHIRVHLTQRTFPHPDGIRQGDFNTYGTFEWGYPINLYPGAGSKTLRHELLHLVQEVGSELIKTSTGWAWKSTKWGNRRAKAKSELDERNRTIFGGPKSKLRAVRVDDDDDEGRRYRFPDSSYRRKSFLHAEKEIEMHADALSTALDVEAPPRLVWDHDDIQGIPEDRRQLARRIARHYSVRQIESQALRKAYIKLVWQIACRQVTYTNRDGEIVFMYPETTDDVDEILFGEAKAVPRPPGMFVAGKRVKGAALEAHREVVAKRPPKVRPFTVPLPVPAPAPAPAPGVRYTSKGQPFIMVDGRARFIRKNPLVGWEDTSGMAAGTALQILVPLVKPGARETFEHGYRNVPVPIAFALRPTSWRGSLAERYVEQNLDTAGGRAAQPNRVRQYGGEERILRGLAEHAVDVALANKLNSLLIVMPIGERPNIPVPDLRGIGKRGSIDRLSPFTVFVVLHRIGDRLSAEMKDFTSDAPKDAEALRLHKELLRAENELLTSLVAASGEQDDAENIAEKEIYSRGVGTAAGRLGVAGIDYMSDLFAKYLLTGKVAYDPVNPPPIYPGEAKFRQTVARIALPLFQRYVHILNSRIPRVVYDGG